MALWIYEQYDAKEVKKYGEQQTESLGTREVAPDTTYNGYDAPPEWSGDVVGYLVRGTYVTVYASNLTTVYDVSFSSYISTSCATDMGKIFEYKTMYYRDVISIEYTKGSYIDTVMAEYGTYPDDGRHTDGYWYVAIGPAWVPPKLTVKIAGALKEYSNGWVKVDGALKEINKMWVKVNGVVREA